MKYTANFVAGGIADVRAVERRIAFAAHVAGSGVRYFDGRVEYWEHHEEAMLNGAARRRRAV